MIETLLNKNLDNVETDLDLFGQQHKRLSMSDRIGFLPISIWKPNWTITKELKAIVGDDGSSRALDVKSGNHRSMGASYKETLGNSPNSVSIFNPHLAQMILSAYCPSKAKIYDPFGGGGTRGFIATAMGHEYVGVEIRQEEVDRIERQQLELKLPFKIDCFDSRFYPIEPEYYDFAYSCPPYYDLEIYSDLKDDMSTASTYEEFLGMFKQSLEVTYKGLKPDSLCVMVVGNLRRTKGDLIHFNGDTVRIGLEVGFKLWDELIFWGASDSAVQRSGQFEANRKSVRVHESIIIFKK